MDEREIIRQKNKQWQQDNVHWQKEIRTWQHDTQRLVALLYMLEKTLPEQSSWLAQHKARIDKHNDDLTRYSSNLDKQYLPDSTSPVELDKQQSLHKLMQQSHYKMRTVHESLHKEYLNKMQQVRDLAQRFIDEVGSIVD